MRVEPKFRITPGMARKLGVSWARPGLFAGVDEAGRGPLAGPVVAAAVMLDDTRPIKGLRDSKQLTRARQIFRLLDPYRWPAR